MKVDTRLDISDCIFTRSENERKSREKNESFGKGHTIVNNRNRRGQLLQKNIQFNSCTSCTK